MKYWLRVLDRAALLVMVIISSGSCAKKKDTTSTQSPIAKVVGDECTGSTDPFATQGLITDVTTLAKPEWDGRAPGSAGDIAGRRYIVERLTCLNLTSPLDSPGSDTPHFEQAFKASLEADAKTNKPDPESGSVDTANIVAWIPGSDATLKHEMVVVSAHHDHFGEGKLGANDNASGVAGVLAIAKSLQMLARAPKRTILFLISGSEEIGIQGSQYFINNPPEGVKPEKIVFNVNLDMVGSYALASEAGASPVLWALGARDSSVAGSTRANQYAAKVIADLKKSTSYELTIKTGSGTTKADVWTFCHERGIPYLFMWTPDDECYHKSCDTVARIDFTNMTKIVSLIADITKYVADDSSDLASFTVPGTDTCGEED